jgi:elongation factor Ts
MVDISAKTVKELRDKTSAGMMDCKKALQEFEGNVEKAMESLKQKGLASANKKSSRIASEGLIEAYVHMGGKLGVIVELNCETDFVARSPAFQELARNVAMQIAACPTVQFVTFEEIPTAVAEEEKRVEMGKNDLGNKPEEIKEKIVEGRIQKRLKEMVLLEQAFIRDNNITLDELVKQAVAKLGENIKIRRFQRFNVGEGLEKRAENFGEEVAKMMNR